MRAVDPRPNVLIMMADDMGFSDIGCYGGEIETPHIDALAAGGVRFSQFYNTARCSPSRASLLTGLHPHQTGIGELVNDDGPGGYPGTLNGSCATLAETFGAAGYRTHLSGKWHLVSERVEANDGWPTRRGFDSFFGTLGGAGSYVQPTTLHDGETAIGIEDLPEDFYYTEAIGDHAAAELRRDAEGAQPFFGYVAFTAPHWPLHATAADLDDQRGRYAEGWDVLRARRRDRQVAAGICADDATLDVRDPAVPAWADEDRQDWQQRRMEAYAAQVVAMDRAVGVVMDALHETGQADNTVVIFLSDNGGCAEELSAEPDRAAAFSRQHLIIPPSAPDGSPMKIGNDPSITPGTADTYTSYGQAWANLSNTPFRLYKRWVHEGGISTPLIISWPDGELAVGSLLDAPNQLTDLAPTLLQAAGVPALTERDGRSLPPLPGQSMLELIRGGAATAHPLFWEHIGNQAMRDGDWKIVREHGSDWELYDLAHDRSEQSDLSSEHPDRVRAMAQSWQTWADGVGALPRDQVLAAQARSGSQPA